MEKFTIEDLKKHDSLYYEYALNNHYYKFQAPGLGYICAMHPTSKKVALEKLLVEVNKRILPIQDAADFVLPGEEQKHVHIALDNHEGHATFSGTPSKESIEAVNKMADLAFNDGKGEEEKIALYYPGYYQPLAKFFNEEHNLILVDSEIQEIIHQVKKFIESNN